MTPRIPTLADLRKVANELEAKMTEARSALRDRWNNQVKPKLEELEKKAEAKSDRAVEVVQEQLSNLGDALDKLQKELAEDLKLGLGLKKKSESESETKIEPK